MPHLRFYIFLVYLHLLVGVCDLIHELFCLLVLLCTLLLHLHRAMHFDR